ncbi:uncharacterized protein MONBRDRAFT_29980 [Monosiga brevicollis MX1]|uniref:AB hydrolase-1 domain-containing protein n=1 Tax=Monosiga brevicollis TaxID=81824 RepID=A9VCN6_MONBE|nr:uncharacterized protein MONBRDRAFT_29980 [Monosiga brevicollis MX1]EDQ84680.1 predicted protein [Monosiga brevicollis MX1]|eukprot:XP_001750466.1 hypothetical protein [Monosiga brevicollis MX1]
MPGATHFPVLLLHGAKFSSATWVELKTMDELARAGFDVYAVDLPGHGRSAGTAPLAPMRGSLLHTIIEALELDHPVLVAPSMSGTYAIPLVLSHPDVLSGFVPIAPAGLDMVDAQGLAHVSIPTLVMYGSEDAMGLKGLPVLETTPNHHTIVFEGGSHACYVESPEKFNRLLVQFVRDMTLLA